MWKVGEVVIRLFKHDLRKELAKWVEKNLGAEFVEEALDKYDKVNSGIPIGGFFETVVFLHMLEKVKAELESR